MAILNLDYLKTFYQTYDKPLEEDFANLIDTLSTTLEIPTYVIPGNNSINVDVNNSTLIDHKQKQLNVIYHRGRTYLFNAPLGKYGLGAIETTADNFVDLVSSQFTEEQIEAILLLISSDITVEESITKDIFEKGVATSNIYTAIINHEDVVITSIKLNNVNVVPNYLGITNIVSNDTLTNSKSYTLDIVYTHNGIPKEYHSTLTSNAYAPQFIGYSNVPDYSNYASTNILLVKRIQADSTLEFTGQPSNHYAWFITNDKSIEIFDQNNNKLRIGDWGGIEFIFHKLGVITLQDGNNQTVALYRSAELLNTEGTDFKFKSK